MSKGFLKISRERLSDWRWLQNQTKFYVFFRLLLKANYEDMPFEKTIVKRGQLMFSYDKLATELGVSLQTLRTTLKDLQNTNEINIQSTRKASLLTICEYESWQDCENEANIQPTYNQHTTNTQLTLSKEIKEKEEIKEKDTIVSKKKSSDYPEEYEQDYKLYERKGSKKNGYKRWMMLTEEDKEKMRRHIPHYLQSNERQFLKDFEGYINQRLFESPVYRGSVLLFDPQTLENQFAGIYDVSERFSYVEQFNAYRVFWPPQMGIKDGYSDDNRPDKARVVYQSTVYTWSAETKKWIETR